MTRLTSHQHRTTLKRLGFALLLVVLVLVGRSASSVSAATPGLHMQGVTLTNADNSRFVVAGINMEMYRDYDNGCGWVTDTTYSIRGAMADRIKGLGVNAVRLNYAYRFLNQSGNLSRFLDMAQELANRGIYVMPSDHTYTGNVLTGASASYPMMKQIIDGMRARGLENYLIMNPFNEPGPDITVAQWVQAQKDVLTYLRNTAGFSGIVVMDGTGWATLLDVNAFKQVMTFDASLRGGSANVAFSMHLYPNITGLPSQLWSNASQVPLVVGELGQENPGASALDPNYVKSTISGALNTGIPNGHNGLFAWIWAWCDSNGMLEDWTSSSVAYTATSPLTSHGTLWQTNYYSKLPSQPSVPTVIAQQPTATKTTAAPTSVPPTATKIAPTATKPAVTVTTAPTTTVAPPPGGQTLVPPPSTVTSGDGSFYRAVNFGGTAMTINGNKWDASNAANVSFKSGTSQGCNPWVTMSPVTDAASDQMLECYAEHWNHTITLNAVPNASYDVYVYTWQDWAEPSPGKVNFSVNSTTTQSNYQVSSQAGHWDKLGPWRINVTNGSLALTTTGANIKLSGIEVWRASSGNATAQPTIIAQQPTATKTNTSVPPTATKTTVAPTGTKAAPTATKPAATATKTTVAPTATKPAATVTKTAIAPTSTKPAATATKVSPTATALPPTVPPPSGDSTFYRAVNFGGKTVTINGNKWDASNAANVSIRSGTSQECNTYVALSPKTDANTEQMVECFIEHWSHSVTLSAVPNASYDVYVYSWQDWNQPSPGTVSFSLNDAVAQSNYAISSQQGHWDKLGPWRVNVSNGSLKLTTNGNNIKLSGIEVWRVGAAVNSVVMAPTAAPADRTLKASDTAATAAPGTFYRGVNLNGDATTIDGNAWDGKTSADVTAIGSAACNTNVVPTPTTDAARAAMLNCYLTGPALKLVVKNVPAGSYQVYAYLWEMPDQYTLTVQSGQQAWFSQPSSNGAAWQKVGPWTVTVDAKGIFQLETTSGIAKLAGIELWHAADNAATTTDNSATTPEIAPTFDPYGVGQAGTNAIAASDTAASQPQPLTQVIESDDARLTRSGDWKVQATGKASGGSYLYSSTATLSFSFTGTQFDVLYVQHPALGSFVIEVDGAVVQTVNAQSAETAFQVAASVRGLSAGQHTVTIHASDGVAAIDAIRLEANTSVH